MAHRSERINARVDRARKARYDEAMAVLGLEEISDYIRRGCDALADATLGAAHPGAASAGASASKTQAKPDFKDKRKGRR